MKILQIPIEDEFYNRIQQWCVREKLDRDRWARSALHLHAPRAGKELPSTAQGEEVSKVWRELMDKKLEEGLYDELAELFRKHGLVLSGFYQNGLFFEEPRVVYCVMLKRLEAEINDHGALY